MPTIFRPARPRPRIGRAFIPSAGSLRSAAGVAAGAATVLGVGVAIKAAVGLTEGATSVNGFGVAIKAFAGTSAGQATASGGAAAIKPIVGIAAGAATVSGVYNPHPIVSTRVLHKPVDYALAGQQERTKTRLGGRALRHAFDE